MAQGGHAGLGNAPVSYWRPYRQPQRSSIGRAAFAKEWNPKDLAQWCVLGSVVHTQVVSQTVANFRTERPLEKCRGIRPSPWSESPSRKSRGFSLRKIGYARVSAQHQNLDRQLGALVAEGCERVYQEKASGRRTMGRPQLGKAIAALGTGRAGAAGVGSRHTIDARRHPDHSARGGSGRIGEGSRQTLPGPDQHHGPGHTPFLSALAQDERERIVKRAQDGRKAAKARGIHFGRKPKLTQHQQQGAADSGAGSPQDRSPGSSVEGIRGEGYLVFEDPRFREGLLLCPPLVVV